MKYAVTLIMLFTSAVLCGQVRVGAKHFTEGYILSEIVSQLLESKGFKVERKYNLGGTMVCYRALLSGEIDVYPEYTGTLSYEILQAGRRLTLSEINDMLKKQGSLSVTPPLGFNNTYALITRKAVANEKKISSISDLSRLPDLQVGLSHEFLNREDGWRNLSAEYDLPQRAGGLEHGLAYQALQDGKIDVTDAYSTDGEIARYDLQILKDDKQFFPDYLATYCFNTQIDPRVEAILLQLAGKFNEQEMQEMNAAVLFEEKTIAEVSANFLQTKGLTVAEAVYSNSVFGEVMEKTGKHLQLTFVSLGFALLLALPLGVVLYWFPGISRVVLYLAGLLQTVPSIALLAILLPITGIGAKPAIIALFLYALLPVLRNTIAGLQSVDPVLKKVSVAMGMNRYQQLYWIELPLAAPVILSGIRTAAVINVGTATLAAFIGAGGLGEFIVTGLALNNINLILQGAIPAAMLAIVLELLFEGLERWLRPAYLKKTK